MLSVICYLDPHQIKEAQKAVDAPHISPRLDPRFNIYSFGLLMWEISSGRTPYYHPDSIGLDVEPEEFFDKIAEGYREDPVKDTPSNYQELYRSCWSENIPERLPIDQIAAEIKIVFENLP